MQEDTEGTEGTISRAGREDRALAGRPRLLVSRSALRHNRRVLRRLAGPGTRLCPVVKADAYGHGAAAVADVLVHDVEGDEAAPGVEALAVATLDEALILPDFEVPTIVLRPIECAYLGDTPRLLDEAVRRSAILSLITPEAALDVARAAERAGVRAHVQVMLDTGMCREMCDPRRFAETIEAVLKRPALRLAAVGTHFTDGELDDEPFSDEQARLFHEALDPFVGRLPAGIVRHAANSGGTLGGHADGFEMVRPGLAVYGLHPSCRADVALASAVKLRPVARWVAPLLYVRDVRAGETAGYNRTWRATRATRLGLVPVGYADGYPRQLGGRGVVRVPGLGGDAICPVVGRVSMDYLTVDLAAAPWAGAGDEVVLLDDDASSPCSAYALAERCGTIPYEILCGVGRRVARATV